MRGVGAPAFEIYTTLGVDSTGVFRGLKSRRLNPSVWSQLDLEFGDAYAGVFLQPTGFENETVPLVYGYGGVAPSAFGIDFNLGASYYAFPWSSPAEFDTSGDDIVDHAGRKGLFEAFIGASRDFGAFEVAAVSYYSPDMYGETGEAWYHAAALTVPLPRGFTFRARYGLSEFAEDQYNDDYADYLVGVEKSLFGFDFSLNYSSVADLAGADESLVYLSISRELSIFSRGARQEKRFGKIRNNWAIDKGRVAR